MINNKVKFLICAVGIFVCFILYGLAQQRIFSETYGEGDNAEKFTYTFSLVFVQCIFNALFASIVIHVVCKQEEEDTTRLAYYVAASLTYLIAMVGTNTALRYVNYPTQVIGKSAKPIPVMVLGVLLGKRVF